MKKSHKEKQPIYVLWIIDDIPQEVKYVGKQFVYTDKTGKLVVRWIENMLEVKQINNGFLVTQTARTGKAVSFTEMIEKFEVK